MYVNNCTFCGNVVADATLKHVNNEPVLNFRIAVQRPTGKGKPDAPVLWLDVDYWGPRAEAIASFVTKGTEVLVIGSIATREYPRNDGSTGFAVCLKADKLELGRKPLAQGAP